MNTYDCLSKINDVHTDTLIHLNYYFVGVFCPIHRLCVYLRMRMSTLKQHPCVRGPLRECRSIRSGASGLPYCCAPLVCVSDVMELLAVWRCNKPKTKKIMNHLCTCYLDCVCKSTPVCNCPSSFCWVLMCNDFTF